MNPPPVKKTFDYKPRKIHIPYDLPIDINYVAYNQKKCETA